MKPEEQVLGQLEAALPMLNWSYNIYEAAIYSEPRTGMFPVWFKGKAASPCWGFLMVETYLDDLPATPTDELIATIITGAREEYAAHH